MILRLIIISFFYFSAFAQEHTDVQSEMDKSQQELSDEFHRLDSLSLALERENYTAPYEKVQLKLIELGQKIDSLDRVAYQAIGLSWFYNNIQGQPQKAIELNQKMLQLDQSKIRDFYTGLLHRELADGYFFSGENTLAIEEYEKAVRIFEALQNEQVLAETLMYLSAPQSNIGDFVNAINTMNRSLQLFEKTGDQYNSTGMRIELGLLYNKYGFKNEANEQYNLLLNEAYANEGQLSAVYINKANMAKAVANYENYFEYINKAETFAKASDRPEFILPTILLSKAETYFLLNETQKANELLSDFERKYASSINSVFSAYKNVLAEKYKSENKLQKAITELEALLNFLEKRKNWSEVVGTRKKLVELYQQTNQLNLALVNQNQYVNLKDSIEADQKIKALSYYKTQFETEKKDKQISQQKSEIQILSLENKNKRKLIAIILGISLVIIVLIWFGRKYLQNIREQKLQQEFSQRLLSAQEEERLKISRDLHDSIGQSLSLIKREVQQGNINEIDQLLGTSIQDLREVSQSIYPYTLKNFGLSYAIQQVVAQIEKTTLLNFKLKIQDLNDEVNEELNLQLYRLIQEALNNIVKHANAKNVVVIVMKKTNAIVVKINDDGDGFDVNYKLKNSKSFGLQTMQQRMQIIKGKLNIKSTGEGTNLEVLIPIN